MATLSSRRIAEFLLVAQNGISTVQQGRSLEDLVCYVFSKMPGITITHRNQLNTFHSEEIDVALWNEKRRGVFDFLPNVIMVEAKNWSRPVGSTEVSWFDQKLRNRGLAFGILVALRGVTGKAEDQTAAHQVIASSLRDQRRIILITADDLLNLRDTGSLVGLVKQKLCELAVAGTVFP